VAKLPRRKASPPDSDFELASIPGISELIVNAKSPTQSRAWKEVHRAFRAFASSAGEVGPKYAVYRRPTAKLGPSMWFTVLPR